MRVFSKMSSTIDDGVPVDVAGESRVDDDVSEANVGREGVGDQVACDELVVELTECEIESLFDKFFDDFVGLFDYGPRLVGKPMLLVADARHYFFQAAR